jgi:hypothetical protein
MRTNRQRFLDNFTALETLLTGETGVHSYDLMSSTCSLGSEDIKELTPSSIANRFGKVMVLYHIGDVQVLYRDMLIGLCILFGNLEMEITPLTDNLEMRLCRASGSLTAAMTVFLASAHRALLASQCTLALAIIARVRNGMTLTIRQERFQSYVNADSRMLTRGWFMLAMWFHLTDDESIPVPICTQDQVHGFRRTLYWAMQLDLEKMSELLGDNEMLLLFMQIAVFAILPQLDGMPAVRFLEPREANTRDVILFRNKEAFERLGETISKHLYGSGWHMLALSLEDRLKIVLGGECLLLLILLLDGLKHLIVQDARLTQACHQQGRLFLIWVQTVLECSHRYILPCFIRNVKQIVPPAGGRQFTHMLESSGPLAALLVGRTPRALAPQSRHACPLALSAAWQMEPLDAAVDLYGEEK